jgi:hypothetical protein
MDMAQFLEPAGESGMSHMNLSEMSVDRPMVRRGPSMCAILSLSMRRSAIAGRMPRFMAQPPLGLREPHRLHREDRAYSPVENRFGKSYAMAQARCLGVSDHLGGPQNTCVLQGVRWSSDERHRPILHRKSSLVIARNPGI